MSIFCDIHNKMQSILTEGLNMDWNGDASAIIQRDSSDIIHMNFISSLKILTVRIVCNDSSVDISQPNIYRFVSKALDVYFKKHNPSEFNQIEGMSPDNSITKNSLARLIGAKLYNESARWHRDVSKEQTNLVVFVK